MLRVLAFVVLAAAAVAALLWNQGHAPPPKVSGFVEADEIRLGSRVGGRVKAVRVAEGKSVKAGDVLVELEAYDLAERRAAAGADAAARHAEHARLVAGPRPEERTQAEERMHQATARLDRLVAGPRAQEIEAARAQVQLAEAHAELQRKSLERTKGLAGHAESEEELDRAKAAVTEAEAAVRVQMLELAVLEEGSRKEDIAAARAQVAEATAAHELLVKGYRAEEIEAAKAAADAADAAIAAIDRQVEELSIRAPSDGVVDAVELRPGDLVAPNAPVLTIVDGARLWVRAYVPENRLDVQIGQQLEVSVDSFPGRRFKAHVTFVARDAEFTPGNVQTPDERSKQVFRAKVEFDEGRDVLRPGMSADVWLPAR